MEYPKGQYWAQRCSPCRPMTYQVLLPLALSLCTRMTPPFIALGTLLIIVTSLNKALSEMNSWCLENSLTPHSAKCEAMLLMRKPHIGPLNCLTVGEDRIEWVKHTRLLGVTIDDRLSWSHHLTDVKKNFVNKLNLLKRSSFLSRNALLDLYFKIILPSGLYGLVVWGGCPNADLLHWLEILHRRAARIIYKLPRDMPTEGVYRLSNWNTLTFYYASIN